MVRDRVPPPKVLGYDDLKLFTNDFSENNFIGKTQFGKVYRGTSPVGFDGMEARDVVVKIWLDPVIYNGDYPVDNRVRLQEEVRVLRDVILNSHPNLVKVIGYCCHDEHEEQLGIVYDLKAQNTLYNLLLKDSFTWQQRIKVAVLFGRLLEFLHSTYRLSPFCVLNIDPAHIMLDQDDNPQLFDFGMLSGGCLTDRTRCNYHDKYVPGCYGYIDPHFTRSGQWSDKTDVFAFGVVLLGLIAKRVFNPETDRNLEDDPEAFLVDKWAREVYHKKSIRSILPFNKSLVHKSLKKDSGFYESDGRRLTKLAMQCVEKRPEDRPTIEQVANCLMKLRVVKLNRDSLGIKDNYSSSDSSPENSHCVVPIEE